MSRRKLLACPGVKLLATKKLGLEQGRRRRLDLVQCSHPRVYLVTDGYVRNDFLIGWSIFVCKQEALADFDRESSSPELPAAVAEVLQLYCPSRTAEIISSRG